MPPITAVLGSFGFAQRVSQDFPECILNGHSVKDILGKNILQFGFVLSELMKNCHDSNEFEEVLLLCCCFAVNFYFSFVLNLLAHITIPKNNRNIKIN